MPNHYFFVDGFSSDDLSRYKDATEIIKAQGTVRYDDGFGTEVNQPFCVATVKFGYFPCDGVDRFIRSLPKNP